jgi:phospholipid transport system transporter-binding protein
MLALPEVLTQSQANACLGGLVQGLKAGAAAVVVVDASHLQTFDSAALAVLMECRRVAASVNKTVQMQSMPTRLRDLAQLYGVSDLLPDSAAFTV